MSISFILIICVTANTWLIWTCLAGLLHSNIAELRAGLIRVRRLTRHRLTASRERVLQRLTCRLTATLLMLLGLFGGVVVLYLPTLWYADHSAHFSDALVSLEALIGLGLAMLAIRLGPRRS